MDRAVPQIDHTISAARAKPQVNGPDEFSAPTPQLPRLAPSKISPVLVHGSRRSPVAMLAWRCPSRGPR
jgi:hypothetical protein